MIRSFGSCVYERKTNANEIKPFKIEKGRHCNKSSDSNIVKVLVVNISIATNEIIAGLADADYTFF